MCWNLSISEGVAVDGWHLAQILACIGEQFTEGDEICGIVVNVRAKQDKLCIWTKTAANEAAQVNISVLSSVAPLRWSAK